MDVLRLKNKIEKLLVDVLGTYTYSNGYTMPAISVGNPQNGIKVNGLEVILPLYPYSCTQRMSQTIYRKELWKFSIIQRNGSNAADLKKAADILTSRFRELKVEYVQQNDAVEDYAMLYCSYCHRDVDI